MTTETACPPKPPPAIRTPEEREAITKAKALLMEYHACSEPEAHRALQKVSMEWRVRLPEVAFRILKHEPEALEVVGRFVEQS